MRPARPLAALTLAVAAAAASEASAQCAMCAQSAQAGSPGSFVKTLGLAAIALLVPVTVALGGTGYLLWRFRDGGEAPLTAASQASDNR